VTWDADRAIGVDLYYDPVVDEHVGNGPLGLIVPGWYFAPQKNQLAAAGWQAAASVAGVYGDGPITGLDNPANATMLLQIAGEFAEPEVKHRLWEAAEEHIEPTWDHASGEFTLGFQLDEDHPRGQWNARTMAGWVCEAGDWSRLFNEPNLEKFRQPTVSGVDFPKVALSQARWGGESLYLAAQSQNTAHVMETTRVQVTMLPDAHGWSLIDADGQRTQLSVTGNQAEIELKLDNRVVEIRRE
jgi:hypothetical protein